MSRRTPVPVNFTVTSDTRFDIPGSPKQWAYRWAFGQVRMDLVYLTDGETPPVAAVDAALRKFWRKLGAM